MKYSDLPSAIETCPKHPRWRSWIPCPYCSKESKEHIENAIKDAGKMANTILNHSGCSECTQSALDWLEKYNPEGKPE